jgi:hypothetical protein
MGLGSVSESWYWKMPFGGTVALSTLGSMTVVGAGVGVGVGRGVGVGLATGPPELPPQPTHPRTAKATSMRLNLNEWLEDWGLIKNSSPLEVPILIVSQSDGRNEDVVTFILSILGSFLPALRLLGLMGEERSRQKSPSCGRLNDYRTWLNGCGALPICHDVPFRNRSPRSFTLALFATFTRVSVAATLVTWTTV